MSGVAEKARFFLERSVPQLREWEQKELFSKDEIRTIVKKRNDHEHRVLSPGNRASDWASYANWEQSLESLRGKRCKRMKLRHLNSAHAGQGRVLSIYDRGVNRHPTSSALWREYLAYTTNVKAAKRYRRTMTDALRMLPNDVQLWIMAGRRAAKNGDMASARSFFMRGCRFCTKDGSLWIEYARCEMEWLEKVDKRKSKPGTIDPLRPDKTTGDDNELVIDDSEDDDEEDGTVLPEPSANQAEVIDKQTAKQLQSNPALDGAIPIAIFDISRKQPFFNPDTAEGFYIMLASFHNVSVQPRIAQHVLDTLETEYPKHPATCSCRIRQPILNVDPMTAEFPRQLREVLSRLKAQIELTEDQPALKRKTIVWIDEYLALEQLDEAIRKVLGHTKNKLESS
ncbi:unnamed protein product [Clonostachys solani]|uniref:U3 small nucleolar RNA-associated protein 6 N-terminal domain-containing protein n=1 Tax=Clonostachys solani TaxID=160281 RepID=A0A9N9VXC0_9HYPO|nr:unnamed protein product [Clonostachys solani]